MWNVKKKIEHVMFYNINNIRDFMSKYIVLRKLEKVVKCYKNIAISIWI